MSADRFVLDSGVAIAWFFPETEKERLYAASVLRLIADGARAHVPLQFHIELAAFLMRRRRTPSAHFGKARLEAALADIDDLGISTIVSPASYRQIVEWSQLYYVQAKDAPFVRLAHQEGLSLAAIDSGQRRAAERFGIALVGFH
ncbi:MAG: hypothetical protein D4S02_17045 [Rhodocyclaceae bacterium]|nr:MAG: hypothetical protein D4S02_17045 [Rhodocyclaceae bacterium]